MRTYSWSDVRHTARSLWRTPLISVLSILALVCGIGWNAGIYSTLKTFWFQTPSTLNKELYVRFLPTYRDWPLATEHTHLFNSRDFEELRQSSRTLDSIVAWADGSGTLERDQQTVHVLFVSCNYFEVFGVNAKVGREFLQGDCIPNNSPPTVLLSERLWKEKYNSSARVIGSAVLVNGIQLEVLGVVPESASQDGSGTTLWIPYLFEPRLNQQVNYFINDSIPWLNVGGVVRRASSRNASEEEVQAIMKRMDLTYLHRASQITVTNGSMIQDPELKSTGWTVVFLTMGMMTLLLMVAVTNLSLLVIARAKLRQQQMATRVALGANGRDLSRLMLLESLFLAIPAAAGGLYLAWLTPILFWRFVAPQSDYYPHGADWTTFVLLGLLITISLVVVNQLPVEWVPRNDLTGALKGQGRGVTTRSRLPNALVAIQTAVSFLMIAASLTFWGLQRRISSSDPGFDANHILLIPLDIEIPPYSPSDAWRLYNRVLSEANSTPGVDASSLSQLTPYQPAQVSRFVIPASSPEQTASVSVNSVSSGFFRTMRIKVLTGRVFTDSDVSAATTAPSAVVSLSFARTFWRDANPIGETIADSSSHRWQVIGVVSDVASEQFGITDGPRVYMLQNPTSFGGDLLVHFYADQTTVAQSLQRSVAQLLKAELPIPVTLQEMSDDREQRVQRMTGMTSVISAVTILLSLCGTYAVISFAVTQRTAEIGVRLLLGASRVDVLRGLIVPFLRRISLGICAGCLLSIPGAWALAKISAHSALSTKVFDPSILAPTIALSLFIAIIAILIPSLRTVAIDPVTALRAE